MCTCMDVFQRARRSQAANSVSSASPPSGGAIVHGDGIMTDGSGTPTGTPLSHPTLIAAISEDPVLRDTKMIAEAWDCDGLNQVRLVCGLEEGSGGAGWCRRDGAAC